MTEEDYGIAVKFTFKDIPLQDTDVIKFTIKDKPNGNTLVEKTYNPENKVVNFVLTSSESSQLDVGDYVYRVDWYRGNALQYNLIRCANFKVVDMA